ncbi:MAG: biotin-dependent carboxyltransferase family protein [Pelagimonas sp.]|jgi:allophanate hydrolase|nr:biotin-dependent carboxyltransferase family protein [Pelagimonas sp.]
MSALLVKAAGPSVTLQDLGRTGYLAQGLSRGGAMDVLALHEGAALLRQPVGTALEMAGFGGTFAFTRATRIALTGAHMQARLGGVALVWNASHLVPAGGVLEIGGARAGVYGYLTIGGGLDVPVSLGQASAHLAAGIGAPLQAGDRLGLRPDAGGDVGQVLPHDARFDGGDVRILPSLQTELFPKELRDRFTHETLTRDTRGNRMGVRLLPGGEGFGLRAGQAILSEVITRGDIQIPGDGAPYVLLSECQTTGGYPRIGTVIPADLPRVAQCAPGGQMRFRFVTRDDALAAEEQVRAKITALPGRCVPLVRDPNDIADLLSYNLIDGVTTGRETR